MARIQILELPTIYRENGDDETPFALVIDQVEPERYILGAGQEPLPPQWEGLAEKVGARAILVFEDTVDIPANEVAFHGGDLEGGTVHFRVEADLSAFEDDVAKAMAAAHHKASVYVHGQQMPGTVPGHPEQP